MAKTILIVDDDAAARTLLRELLTPEGYRIVEAADGVMALGVLESQKVDLMITDRAMPGMDGLELLKKLQEREISLPTLILSAFGEEQLWGQAIGLGASDYLLKPFVGADVLKIVKKQLGKKKK